MWSLMLIRNNVKQLISTKKVCNYNIVCDVWYQTSETRLPLCLKTNVFHCLLVPFITTASLITWPYVYTRYSVENYFTLFDQEDDETYCLVTSLNRPRNAKQLALPNWCVLQHHFMVLYRCVVPHHCMVTYHFMVPLDTTLHHVTRLLATTSLHSAT